MVYFFLLSYQLYFNSLFHELQNRCNITDYILSMYRVTTFLTGTGTGLAVQVSDLPSSPQREESYPGKGLEGQSGAVNHSSLLCIHTSGERL